MGDRLKRDFSVRKANRNSIETVEVITKSQEEVSNAVELIKNRKSPGPDNIAHELLKYGRTKLNNELTKLNKSLANGLIADD